MKKKIAITIIGLTVVFSIVACGNKDSLTVSTETNSIVEDSESIDTENYELTELEQKIVEFKNNTSSEVTLIQDLLRGEWHINGMEVALDDFETGFSAGTAFVGDVTVHYDSCSRDSSIIFTNDEFIIVYEEAYVKYKGDEGYTEAKNLQNAIVISGLYRVTSPAIWDEESCDYNAEIEMLVTNVTQKNEIEDEKIFELLNKVVGMTSTTKIGTSQMYVDEFNITEEDLESRNVEIHEAVNYTVDAYWGYREDGSYGVVYYDTPIPARGIPFTSIYVDGPDEKLIPYYVTKIKNSVDIGNGEVEPGVFLYDIEPQEDEAIEE